MNFKELFENAVLTEETQQVLVEAFEAAIQAKEVELQEQFDAKLVEEKANMMQEMIALVEEAVTEEMEEIKEEVTHARTLEVQYADKLEAFKESYDEAQTERVQVMIAEAVAEEVDELREDIELAKKHEFVMQVFESFKDVYDQMFGGVDISAYDELQNLKEEVDTLRREKKLAELLEGLEGRKRTIAQTILETVATEKLEEKFEAIQGVLLSEASKDRTDVLESKSVSGRVIMENEEEDEDEEDDEDEEKSKSKDKEDKEIKESVDPMVARLEKSLSWINR